MKVVRKTSLVMHLPKKSSSKNQQKVKGLNLHSKVNTSSVRHLGPSIRISPDRGREMFSTTSMLEAASTGSAELDSGTSRAASPSPPESGTSVPPAADPVAEALRLIQEDMCAQARSGADPEAIQTKKPVTIRLDLITVPNVPPAEPRSSRRTPPPPPPREKPFSSVFPDDIEEFCVRVRRSGRGASVTDGFSELLQRQTDVLRLQRQLRQQVEDMRSKAAREEQQAVKERRRRFGISEGPPAPPPDAEEPTTAADSLMVLREERSGCCGPADMCVQPGDLPRALQLIHRLRCEVLEMRACALRTTMEKNEVAMKLNHERAQLRRTFTNAQLYRLTGAKMKERWDAEDVKRAISARRVLTRRQYRYLVRVLGVPLPAVKLDKIAAREGEETKELYEQLNAEKTLAYRTKKAPVNRKARAAAAASRAAAAHLKSLIEVTYDSSDSEAEGDSRDVILDYVP